MKKNLVIIILTIVIFIFLYNILQSSVVTQRKVENKNNTPQNIIRYEVDRSVKDSEESKSSLVPEFRLIEGTDQFRYFDDVQQNTPNKQEINFDFSAEFVPEGKIETKNKTIKKSIPEKNQGILNSSIDNNLLMCRPYKESMSTKYMGVSINYAVEILGWEDDKCVLNFNSDIYEMSDSYNNSHDASIQMPAIFGFAPKVRCEFTKQQLEYVGDSILEENKSYRKMLKNPDQIELPDVNDMSFNDLKLLQIILNDKACKVLNAADYAKIFENLFEF